MFGLVVVGWLGIEVLDIDPATRAAAERGKTVHGGANTTLTTLSSVVSASNASLARFCFHVLAFLGRGGSLASLSSANTSMQNPIPTKSNPGYERMAVANRDNASHAGSALTQLASTFGIVTEYRDGRKQERVAPTETIHALLRALDAPGDSVRDPEGTLRAARAARDAQLTEPVWVAWDGQLPPFEVRGASPEAAVTLHIELESDELLEPDVLYTKHGFKASDELSFGRHRATLRCGGREQSIWIISAPSSCPRMMGKHWGVFAPTYALHSKRSLGIGDLGDLSRLAKWLSECGGSTIATLPLCAAFLNEPLEISPYAPVSRMHWNELYLDVSALPEVGHNGEVRTRLQSTSLANKAAQLNASDHVDHKRAMALKRSLLEPLAHQAFAENAAWTHAMTSRPQVAEYARFRAEHESGDLEQNMRYHVYVQLAFEAQLRSLQRKFTTGPGLYLDVPVGVHRDGFDAWKFPEAFLPNTAAGAPPDALFTGGQNWGFSPAHPVRIRESGYDYMYRYLRALALHAGILRIDHVMGLHRIFAIPDGTEGKDGTYIRFHAEEQWAILCLVAHQCGCIVVGEDLGTVPAAVRKAMDEHETLRMFVGLYSFADRKGTLRAPKSTQVSSLGTHDTPTLAGFLEGRDIDERFEMGILNAAQKKRDHLEREQLHQALAKKYGRSVDQIHRGLLKALAASDSPLLLATLEDCWGEARPQNTPGTGADWANWKRRMTQSLEQIMRSDRIEKVTDTLQR